MSTKYWCGCTPYVVEKSPLQACRLACLQQPPLGTVRQPVFPGTRLKKRKKGRRGLHDSIQRLAELVREKKT